MTFRSRAPRGSWFTCLALLVIALGFAGCDSAPRSDTPGGGASAGDRNVDPGSGPIKIGFYGSLTGNTAVFGNANLNGARLAVEEINAAGGINGRTIELISQDTQSRDDQTSTAVRRLIESDKVVVLVGEVASTLSLAGGRIAQQSNVPMVSPASTNVRVTPTGDMIFRVCFIDPFQGYAVAKFARENLGLSRAAILFDQEQDYSTGLRDAFRTAFTEMGGEIVAVEAYTSDTKDYGPQITSLRATNAEMVFVPGYYNQIGDFMVQARQRGLDVPILGGDGWESPTLVEIAGQAIEGSYYSNHFAPDNPDEKVQGFLGRFKAKYNQDAEAMAALGYDAILVVADALKRVMDDEKPLSSRNIAEALSKTSEFPGITGSITIDEDRNASKAATILQIKDGRKQFAAMVEPDAR
jgi:branched-chain amino acid transport system substrate-binding protein